MQIFQSEKQQLEFIKVIDVAKQKIELTNRLSRIANKNPDELFYQVVGSQLAQVRILTEDAGLDRDKVLQYSDELVKIYRESKQ